MQMLKRVKYLFFAVVLLTFVTLCVVLYQKNNRPVERVDYVLDTVVVQSVAGSRAAEATAAAADYLREFEQTASAYREGSQVSELRRQAGVAPVVLEEELYQLVARSAALCKESGGVVDITIQPVSALWRFEAEEPALPQEAELLRNLALVGIDSLVLDDSARSAYLPQKGQGIELGAVAKGYLCDRLAEIYKEYGVQYAVTSLGGNVFVYSKGDKAFTVGIRNPDAGEDSILGLLPVENQVIATSGDYERRFTLDGREYHHILDTGTGYPAQSDLKSVTVIGEDGLLCDFLSTYYFIAGSEAVRRSLSDERFSLVAIDRDNRVYLSDNLSTFVLLDSSFTVIKGGKP